MNKKIRIAVLCLALVAILATGCSKASSKTTTTVANVPEKVSITFLNSKGEIQTALEKIAVDYEKRTGVHVEIVACGAGDVPYTKITTMYNSGNAPTMAMLDTLDIVSLAKEYALDLSNEKWTAECADQLKYIDGTVYSFPFCVEGRGIIYNKAAIEKTLGRTWDPASVKSLDDFKALLAELRSKGMENPVNLSKEDWSLGAHQLGFIYDAYDGTTDGAQTIIAELEGGLDPASYERFNQFVDTLDVLMEYNINKADPLGADYDIGAMDLASGEVAFWPNGCWAWPTIAEGGATIDEAFGFLPFFLGNDETDFANYSIQASPSKQVMIDKKQASAQQVQAAKDFLDWLVYDAAGQQALVEECALIPACTNNPYAPLDPLGQDIVAKMAAGHAYSSSFIAPSDHWSKAGAAVQKYLSGTSDRAELAATLGNYWKSQK